MKHNLSLVIYPNSILKSKALPVEKITPELIQIANEMLDLMYESLGIGLAANQVGILKQIIVVDLQINDERKPMIFFNPKIIYSSDDYKEVEEGCLSLPELKEMISRPNVIEIEYLDVDSKICKLKADGLLSVCLQHEIDHLNGILFVDRVSKIKKQFLLKKFKKLQKEAMDS